MTTDKPDLPKRMAAKIVAAQNAVTAARRHLHVSAQRLLDDRRELAEYERDPVAYAAQHYPGLPVESYPVQEHIRRRRADVVHRTPRQSLHQANLAAADAALEEVELAVLDEVQRMRPDTPGRVPWPDPLPSLEGARAQWRWDETEAALARAEQEAVAEAERVMRESAAFDKEVEATLAQVEATIKQVTSCGPPVLREADNGPGPRAVPTATGLPVASSADTPHIAGVLRETLSGLRTLWTAWRR